MFWNRRTEDLSAGEEDRAVRRLFEAAASDPGANQEPPPFFAARVKARAKAMGEERRAAHPFGAAAWQMLPALALVVVSLTAWTGYESVRAGRERKAALAEMLSDNGKLNEAILATMLLGPSDSNRGAR
jgi:hypothetical protein